MSLRTKKIKAILIPAKEMDETDRILSNSYLVKKLDEACKEIKEGKGVKIEIKDLWK